ISKETLCEFSEINGAGHRVLCSRRRGDQVLRLSQTGSREAGENCENAGKRGRCCCDQLRTGTALGLRLRPAAEARREGEPPESSKQNPSHERRCRRTDAASPSRRQQGYVLAGRHSRRTERDRLVSKRSPDADAECRRAWSDRFG